jgi:AraC-like DNA-binding protein
MELLRYRPGYPLDRCVECFWWSTRDRPQDFAEHMLPSGSAQLLFALHDLPLLCDGTSWSGSILHGPQSRYYRSGPKPSGAVAGVAFRAGMSGVVLGLPAAELADRHVPLDALWGARGRGLREALLEASSPAAVFRMLERDLTARLRGPPLVHPAVARALAACSGASTPDRVEWVQRESGYSPRHFAALFRAAVGMTPKHYYRIRRFTVAVKTLAGGPPGTLVDLAAALGYADQPHLNREFREFAGITPTQYRPRNPDSPLHHRS